MQTTGKGNRSILLVLALVLLLIPALGMTAQAESNESTYTLTIPARVNVSNTGWKLNENNSVVTNTNFTATEGITASGSLPPKQMLYVTAQSENGFYLKSRLNDAIHYALCATEQDANTVRFWDYPEECQKYEYNFPYLTSEPTTLPMGVVMESITGDFDRTMVPTGTYSDVVTFMAKVDWRDLKYLTEDYTADDGDVLTGTLNYPHKVYIPDGATVTLRDMIQEKDAFYIYDCSPINCQGDATLILEGSSSIHPYTNDYSVIFVPEGKTLTIRGNGSLDILTNAVAEGAAIGASKNIPCGNITIEGGTISVLGHAGIGGGVRGNCGNITITGGTITANGYSGAAIGGGQYATCGDITITGGTITATTIWQGAAIGSGMAGSCGDITIANTVTKVHAIRELNETREYTGTPFAPDYPPHLIGKGATDLWESGDEFPASCGTIKIGNQVVQSMDTNEYIYEP